MNLFKVFIFSLFEVLLKEKSNKLSLLRDMAILSLFLLDNCTNLSFFASIKECFLSDLLVTLSLKL